MIKSSYLNAVRNEKARIKERLRVCMYVYVTMRKKARMPGDNLVLQGVDTTIGGGGRSGGGWGRVGDALLVQETVGWNIYLICKVNGLET